MGLEFGECDKNRLKKMYAGLLIAMGLKPIAILDFSQNIYIIGVYQELLF